MPLGPFDEYLAHQTSDTFDHVATSDRNFYDRYYFNMHSSSDELFVITGLGQYPNLGVTDAFITVSIGTEQHTVRASRELGIDRMDTSVGPLSVEVIEGLQQLRIRCDDNEWGIAADLTFTGAVAALEEPRTFIRRYGRVIQDVSRYAQVGTWEGTHHRRRPHVRRHARPLEGRARPLVGRPPGRRARAPGHQGARRAGRLRVPPRLVADAVRRPHAQGADRPGRRRQPAGRGVDAGVEPGPGRAEVEELGRPEVDHRLPARHARDARRDGHRARRRRDRDHGDEHAAAHAVPGRGFGLREPRRVGATACTRVR